MRRYSQRQNLSTLSEINITPLLDLAFVLLIIFMITTPLLESTMNLVIPSSGATNPPIKSAQVQIVSIDRNDTIRFNNQVIDLKALTARLTESKQTNPDIAVVIRPDRDLPVQKLITLMDALKQAQITKVGIATRAESK
ncbi:MAG TPA: biopolymer transporter ExbD [Candidatus Dormibacteraeota bacterium]|jgi:biopolymer transport protein ExbD|nr:biopolymer transporter ExbD [Candidatus Dormibacteraeota bacterium]